MPDKIGEIGTNYADYFSLVKNDLQREDRWAQK